MLFSKNKKAHTQFNLESLETCLYTNQILKLKKNKGLTTIAVKSNNCQPCSKIYTPRDFD